MEILDFSDCGKDDTSDSYIINAVDKIDTLTAGMIRESRIPKIGKLSVQHESKGRNSFGFSTAIAAEDKRYGYVYKFLSGQVPRSKIAIHYLFKYDKKKEAKYKPMGIYMANSLDGYPDQP
ncbi:MAG: hypothetical protein M0D57_18645 [Sphingobacteriales bacterium JAD_PAG50586_3]|nr:MAG: hypothetical protein M0D57_18645 [Sphingobacteriales bacterium JAD_PAG50586_3]